MRVLGEPMKKNIHHPIEFHNLNLKNALVRSATNEHMATAQHTPSDKLILFYEEIAKHVGLIITGFCFPSLEEIVTKKMLGLYEDEQIAQYQRLCDAVHKKNTCIFLQIVAGGNFKTKHPIEYSLEELRALPSIFAQCARRAKEAGFDGVQLHFAHGYVCSQFLSPSKNQRHDAYGGNLENRSRLLIDILKEVRQHVPNFHISAKLNCDDFEEHGFTPQEAHLLAKQLETEGLYSLEISGGNCTTLKQEGFYTKEADSIAKALSIPVYCVGGYTSVDAMQEAYNETSIAAYSMSRALTNNPCFTDKDHQKSNCVKCGQCFYRHCPCVQELSNRMLFASDFDGTLAKDHHTIEDKNVKAIQAFALPHVFGIVSGRDPLSLMECCKNAHLPYDFLICFNGALCIDVHEDILYDSPITKSLTDILHYLKESDAFSYHIVGHHQALLNYTNKVCKESIAFEMQQFKAYDMVQHISDMERVYMITCEFQDDETALLHATYINEHFSHLSASANTRFIDIMNNGVSKANSVHHMMTYFHVLKDQVYVIGDSYNDDEMIKQFHGFAIKGNKTVEQHAQYIVEDVHEALAIVNNIENESKST